MKEKIKLIGDEVRIQFQTLGQYAFNGEGDENEVIKCFIEVYEAYESKVKSHITHILDKQQEFGVSVEFLTEKNQCSSGNLGKIQDAIIRQSKEKIILDANDDTFRYISFVNEDDALRYVATEPNTVMTSMS